ncbi:MAG: hypothetical protein JRI71_10220 [Deltaproteobacteria bacterium]|nr:hypothetical protein [Deltaproteobacteria bacterium]
MVFDLIPVEMRCPSVITALLFTIGVPLFWYLHRRIASLETVVIARCIDIEKLAEIADNLEKMIGSIKVENQRTIEWIRAENTERGKRIEKDIAEIRQKLYKGD